jgi:hypothetical protein
MAQNVQRAMLLRRELNANELRCTMRNVRVEVLSINTLNNTANCSVEQVLLGWSLYRYDRTELLQMAERALSPLMKIGLSPMITVRHETLQNRTVTTESVMDHPWMRWLRPVFGWFGGSSSKNEDQHAGAFGWKHALELIPVRVAG